VLTDLLIPYYALSQYLCSESPYLSINLLKSTVCVMHHQFHIQQFYVLPTLYLCVLYVSKQIATYVT
jgi:hypothetical protein